uniref:Uncharacterized protein n=1 Tax=Knipowitschia caucasica TaxID=637954 RepID=A0AAV2IZI4_KNICA
MWIVFRALYKLQNDRAECARGWSPSTTHLYAESLLQLRFSERAAVPPPDIPPELRNTAARHVRRKRGRRGGVHRRLKRLCLQDRRRMPALPSILLGNAQSLRNKLDELEAWATVRQEITNACLLVFTESWLTDTDRDEDLSVRGFGAPYRLDRDQEITGKSRGGGVCLYVNERYCKTVVVREKICTPHVELLSLSLRPFYLPHSIAVENVNSDTSSQIQELKGFE